MLSRESDLAFIARLLAEEGLSYHVEHLDGEAAKDADTRGQARHVLVITDAGAALPELGAVRFYPPPQECARAGRTKNKKAARGRLFANRRSRLLLHRIGSFAGCVFGSVGSVACSILGRIGSLAGSILGRIGGLANNVGRGGTGSGGGACSGVGSSGGGGVNSRSSGRSGSHDRRSSGCSRSGSGCSRIFFLAASGEGNGSNQGGQQKRVFHALSSIKGVEQLPVIVGTL